MTIAEITIDHVAEPGEVTRKGKTFEGRHDGVRLHFRTKDDDGELIYEGWLLDDVDTLNQERIRDYAAYDCGATSIEVRRGGRWIRDLI